MIEAKSVLRPSTPPSLHSNRAVCPRPGSVLSTEGAPLEGLRGAMATRGGAVSAQRAVRARAGSPVSASAAAAAATRGGALASKEEVLVSGLLSAPSGR